jgi:hypothetical protein
MWVSHRLVTPALAILLAGGPVGAAASPDQQTVSAASRATLADVTFIAGRGVGELNGGVIEEHWSLPNGDAMMGMFSYATDGRARFYEFLLIEQTAAGLVLRLKHFNPGLIGWEEKAEVFSYPLIEIGPKRAVFERPDKQTKLTFDGAGDRTLAVTLDQLKDGKWTSSRFVYQHTAPAPPASR